MCVCVSVCVRAQPEHMAEYWETGVEDRLPKLECSRAEQKLGRPPSLSRPPRVVALHTHECMHFPPHHITTRKLNTFQMLIQKLGLHFFFYVFIASTFKIAKKKKKNPCSSQSVCKQIISSVTHFKFEIWVLPQVRF